MAETSELERLLERFRRVEALYSRTDVAGERAAAEQALHGILEQIRKYQQSDPPVEYQISLSDGWARRLFLALARRYQLEPYRYPRQRRSTVMIKVSRSFLNETLWPEYVALQKILFDHLDQVTNEVIEKGLHSSDREATEVAGSPPALPGPTAP